MLKALLLSVMVLTLGAEETLLDLRLPQEARYYLPKHAFPIPDKAKLKSAYLEQWYAPWTGMEVMRDFEEVFWMQDLFKAGGYDAQLRPNNPKALDALWASMDTAHYPSVALKAVVVKDADVRATPTDKPYYNKIGSPFDRWQNSMIFAGTPVLITHYNTDRTYAHIQSSFVYGWVKVEQLALVKPATIQKLMAITHYITPLEDKIPLYDRAHRVVANTHMGEILALAGPQQVYTYAKDSQGFAKLISTPFTPRHFTPFPRPLSPRVMAAVIDTMLGQPYGWGGSDQKRDCSAFTRDSFASFGILLPRNSLAQVRYANNMVDLSQMSAPEKERYIIKHATPFATILWLKGHIMLYLGTHAHKAIVAHNIWAISVGKSRSVHTYTIGKTVITTLELGKENRGLSSKTRLLIDRVEAMSDLYDYSLKLAAH
ncbi:SH3 domain-containing C40 family peptidase [Helicobacter vulpis]|uniref:SH3 domain-containing C40 family peptidase n=1 Tax=Helicobacter vulpis TaxID=2316076 RepID=UPI000EB53AEE|nr:SH3 domain-containing C40 family peptidase [Helicobacter vulpis]